MAPETSLAPETCENTYSNHTACSFVLPSSLHNMLNENKNNNSSA